MEENIYGIIYKFTSKTTKKSYIGQTISSNLKRRIYRHRTDKIDSHFYRARDKYGFDDFEFSIIETNISLKDGKKLLDEREIYWISQYDSTDHNIGYNLDKGGHVISEACRKAAEKHLFKAGSKLDGIMLETARANGMKFAKQVCQFDKLTGECLAEFPSIMEASRSTGCDRRSIQRK